MWTARTILFALVGLTVGFVFPFLMKALGLM